MIPRVSGTIGMALGAFVLLACPEPLSPHERILVERQKFSVQLISWAPVSIDRLALDLQVEVRGRSDLDQVTVEVRQVGADDQVLRADLLSLDVGGMGFDDRRPLTVEVPSAGEGVRAVGVVLEVDPDESTRGAYPEFAGI